MHVFRYYFYRFTTDGSIIASCEAWPPARGRSKSGIELTSLDWKNSKLNKEENISSADAKQIFPKMILPAYIFYREQ
jgi:hypothetical protein